MGLCLFFLPNFPGSIFIQGGIFIPDSRVIIKNSRIFFPKNYLKSRGNMNSNSNSKIFDTIVSALGTLRAQDSRN